MCWYLAHDPGPVPHLFRVLWLFWLQRDLEGQARSWVEQFRDAGPLDVQAIRSQIGKGGDQLMPMFINNEELETIAEELEKHRSEILKERYLPKVTTFPRVREVNENRAVPR